MAGDSLRAHDLCTLQDGARHVPGFEEAHTGLMVVTRVPCYRPQRPLAKSRSLRRFVVPDTTCHMSISLDGFVAGPDQSREDPLGKRGLELHGWHIGDPRANDADKIASEWLMRPRGAYVMGRNMFGPVRGASTVRQALIAGVIDELTLDIAPVLLGSGERIFDGVESFGFEPAEVLHSPLTTHIRYRRVSSGVAL
jgi:dihydrofolate reductase